MKNIMKSKTKSKIRILKGGWKVAEENDDSKYVKELVIKLSISGDKKKGYHLFMEPEGCFAADSYHESLEDAIKVANEDFGVTESEWL
jgi:hypothetical protein